MTSVNFYHYPFVVKFVGFLQNLILHLEFSFPVTCCSSCLTELDYFSSESGLSQFLNISKQDKVRSKVGFPVAFFLDFFLPDFTFDFLSSDRFEDFFPNVPLVIFEIGNDINERSITFYFIITNFFAVVNPHNILHSGVFILSH